jgi:hypothetical protein
MPETIFTVRDVFGWVGLSPQGPLSWKQPIPEKRPGVYIISLVDSQNARASRLKSDRVLPAEYAIEHPHWLTGQPVVYIGRTKGLHDRLCAFYRQRYWRRGRHRGGKAVTVLTCPLWVFWAATSEYKSAEKAMLEKFKVATGQWPFANRRA